MSRTPRAARAAVALLAVLSGSFVLLLPSTRPAVAASIEQPNGCLGVTGTFSAFAVPITGTAAPDPATVPEEISLSGTSVQIQVAAQLIATGVTTGLVAAAPSLADIGTSPSIAAPNGRGVNAVTAEPGDVTLKIKGSNTTEDVQVASNPSPVSLTFYVVKDPGTGVVTVYNALSSPPSTTADPARTGTVLSGNLPVTIQLGDTTWTPTGGDVHFTELNIAPSNLLTPIVADKTAAPLILLPKINGIINVPFYCWPGTVSSASPGPNPLIPGASTTIDTVAVTGGSSTSSTSSSSTSSTSSTSTSTTSTSTSTSSTSTTSTTAPAVGPTSATGTGTYTATCSNSVTPDESTFRFTITGTAPTEVDAGDEVTLTKQSWKVDVPGTVLDTGLNLGLLQPGQKVQGTIVAGVFARNTAEGLRTSAPTSVSVGPIVVDGVTGLADPASATVPIKDMSWTAVGGRVSYVMGPTKFQATIGALKVDFSCSPNDTSEAVVTTEVIGKTDIPPATEVAGETISRGGALARTGAPGVPLLLIAALILLDLGYLIWSASRSPRARFLA